MTESSTAPVVVPD